MKVLYTTYQTAFQFPGGGEVILSKCREYLEKRIYKTAGELPAGKPVRLAEFIGGLKAEPSYGNYYGRP